jgi:hypothetical protein
MVRKKVIDDFGNGMIHEHRRYLNRLADEQGTKAAKTVAIDTILAAMTWLAERDGNRATYELMSVISDHLLGEMQEA